MGKEEQAEELEILESIYPEELEVIDETSLAVHLRLETDPPKQLRIDVQYTEDYPESAIPLISIVKEAVGGADGGADSMDDSKAAGESDTERRFDYDFTTADCRALVAHAQEVGEENLGISSVFTIISAVKERAEDMFSSQLAEQEAARLRELHLEEEREQAKFRGTPVTKQSFAQWRQQFRAEMGWDKPRERPFGRLTGKEIFERGIAEDEGEDDEESE